MFTHLTNTTKSLVFYAIALTLALAVALIPGDIGQLRGLLYMLTPAVAVLIMLLVVTRDGYTRAGWATLGLHRLGLRGWGYALLVPLLAFSGAYGVAWSAGIAPFAWGEHTPLQLIIETVVEIVIATLTASLGEELGWRGYLLPQLESLGPRRAMLLTGLAQTVWHFPMIFLTTLYHPEGNPLIVIPLFFASVMIIEGFFIGYLRLATGSVWPASIAHSAHNAFVEMFAGLTVASGPLVAEYLLGESGILTLAGYALVLGGVAYFVTKHPRVARPPAVQHI